MKRILALCSLVAASLCVHAQTVTVTGASGTAGPYTTLRAAFTAINGTAQTGRTISINISGTTNEGATTATLSAGTWITLTIIPTGGAAAKVAGATTAGSPLIDLSGADNVTINGLNTGGNTLTIENTTVSATSGTSTIRFIGGATGNTVTNCTVNGAFTGAVGTNGGNIFFSTDAVTANGNDNNTISNCNIRPSGTNLPTKGIYGNGSTTTTAIGNSGISISNNNIFDYFGAAVTSAGIYTANGCNGWSITNNRFYQTGLRTWTTGAQHAAIWLLSGTANSGMQGATITGNTIGYASSTQTGTYSLTGSTGKFMGILITAIAGGTINTVSGNTIASANLSAVTSSGTISSPFTGIMATSGYMAIHSNTIGSQSATGSLVFSTNTTTATDVYGIYYGGSDTWASNSNTIGGLSATNAGAGSLSVYGMRAGGTNAWTASFNTIGGPVASSIALAATAASSTIYGMYNNNTASGDLTANTVYNLASSVSAGPVYGIYNNTGSYVHTVSQNTVYALTNTGASVASVYGILFAGAPGSVVERNHIHSLSTSTTGGTLYGCYIAGGTNNEYRNNMIRLGLGAGGASIANNMVIMGIYDFSGTNINLYHNSIYIGGSNTVGTNSTYCVAIYPSVEISTANTRDYRNNIFYNARSGTGKHYAVSIPPSSAFGSSPPGLTLNNNDYYAPGTGGVLGNYSNNDVASLAAWQTAVGMDANSISADPLFRTPNGTSATVDLHILGTSPAKGKGTPISTVTNDYDGQGRSTSTPEMGADQFFVGLSSLAISTGSLSPTFATGTTVYTATSVPDATTSATVTPTLVDGTASLQLQINGGGYAATGNGSPSSTLTLVPGNNIIDIKATATDGTVGIYTITLNRAAITVTGANTGNGQYNTLAAAFTAIGSSQTGTNITISIAGNTTETGTATLAAGTWASLSIKPSGGGSRTISGAMAAGTPLVDLRGADNVTIDGLNTGGNALTFENTTVSATAATSTIRFIGGATGNTITNCSIKGAFTGAAATDGGTILFSTDAVTANGNDNNTISNCNIGPSGTNLPTKGIHGSGSTSTTAIGNSGISIVNNNIFDYFSASVTSAGIFTTDGCNTWSITNNRFYQTATRNWSSGSLHSAIYLGTTTATSGMQGATVTGNTIGYASSTQTGMYALTTSRFVGIFVAAITGGAVNTISGNTIASVSVTKGFSGALLATPFTAIMVANGPAITNSNTIGSQSATGSLVFSSKINSLTEVNGIYMGGTDAWVSNGNSIGGLSMTIDMGLGAFFAYGMRQQGTGAWTAQSNTIGGMSSNSIQLSTYEGALFGMYAVDGAVSFSTNTVRNMAAIGINGITVEAPVVTILSQNTVYGLNGTDGTTGINVNVGAGSLVEGNLVHSLNTGTAGTLYGFYLSGNGMATYKNNMVRLGLDATGASISNAATIYGIYETGGTNTMYNNSIYIGGSNVATGTASSYAFKSNVTVNTRNFRNNIFQNTRSNASGTGKHYAISLAGTAANPTGLTIDYNDYHVSGTGGVLGYYNSADVPTLAVWQTAVGQDAHSLFADPQFRTPDGTSVTGDLHLQSTSPAIAKAVPIAGITDDYDGDTRNASTPDMGADETVPLITPIISFFGNMTKAVTDGPFTITAPTSNSTGAFTYTSSNTAVATVSGSTITIVGLGTTTITASQAADATYNSSSILATLTVTNAMLNRYGAVTSNGTGTVNRNGALGGGTTVDRYGRIISATVAPDGLTAGKAASSAYAIKQAYPASTDGLYWITNPNINSGTPFQVYADMTTDGGGWTLLLCNTNATGWTYSNALALNTASPSISTNYSIVGWADYLKKSASGFQYMIDAGTRGSNGAIWTANAAYSFVNSSNTQTNVTINTKFGTWTYDDNGIEEHMPWYSNCAGILTTSASCSSNNSGSLIATSGTPAPWIIAGCGVEGCQPNPGIIWYWVR